VAIAATAIEDEDIVATDAKLRRRYPARAHTIRSLIPEANDKHRASVTQNGKAICGYQRVFSAGSGSSRTEKQKIRFSCLCRGRATPTPPSFVHTSTHRILQRPVLRREQCLFNNARWLMKRRKETQKLKYKICPRRRAPLDADVFSPVEIKSPLDAELISIPDSPPLTFSRWRLMPSQWTEKAVLNSQSPKSPWTTSDTSHPKVPSIYWGN
jgi:hypothetical protein